MLPYDDVRRDFASEFCTPIHSHPSNWWSHPRIGRFWIDIINNQVSRAQYALIMNDLIRNRPP
jgi:hypothetical protein